MSIKNNLSEIKDKISNAEKKAGRTPGSVKLIAVSKFHPVESVVEAIACGQNTYGENRVQEASDKFIKIYETYPETELHIIGQLQTNKVKKAVEIATWIQSVDRIELLKEIDKQCAKLNKNIKILFEIHTGEESKSGYTSEEELIKSIELCKNGEVPHIEPMGLMTMAPFTDDKDLIRNSFRKLKNLSEKLQKMYPNLNLSELSMGMSGDFEIAIEEGATMVRVGTAIFGERDYSK